MSTTHPLSASVSPKTPLTRNQIRGFLASWGGWALDGMDSFIYALVLVPALRELLPRSGIAATNANVGYYGAILFALFLIGWGLALMWGPIADRFGRMRTLMLTVLCFSVFMFLAAIANYFVGAHYGWRAMFIVGGTPALLIAFFYNRVQEPARWRERKNQLGSAWTALHAFKAPFSKLYRRRTVLNSIYMLASIAGLW